MKKFFNILLILLFIIIISYFGYKIYQKTQYPLHKVSALLNSVELPDNFHFIEKISDEYRNCSYEILYKDGLMYRIQNTTDLLNNLNYDFLSIHYGDQLIAIDHTNNTIIEYTDYFPTSSNLKYFALDPIGAFFLRVSYRGEYDHESHYKYHGKEKINGKTCLKVSFTTDCDNRYNQIIFYIDLDTNLIIRTEYIEDKGSKPYCVADYEYHFNTIDELKTFNINDYPDYTYKKETALIP